MKKADFIARIVENSKDTRTKAATTESFELICSTIVQCLEEGEDVALDGIGKLVVVDKEERVARNPQSGEAITIKAHKAVSFRASKALKEWFKK